ncbi:MAG TPA: class I SAM-dependent methyltransferase [Syntrophorhabdaceae bacterium]|jgi:SAM-dependent methyltransferase
MEKQLSELEGLLGNIFKDKPPLVLLEAGCGSMSHIRIRGTEKTVGIDISAQRLERNSSIQERIVGDLETYPLPEATFDAVICWNVLEHLSRPEKAVMNFTKTLKEQGVLILAFPNLLSVKGLVTKFTPYWFHVLFYRVVMGDREGDGQFPTYVRPFIEPRHLKKFLEAQGFLVNYFRLYEGPVQKNWRDRFRTVDFFFSGAGMLLKLLSLGKVDANETDCILVATKEAAPVRRDAVTGVRQNVQS